MNICILATASAKSGALSIYNQFLDALNIYRDSNTYHIIIDTEMPTPSIPNVYYYRQHTKGFGRIAFDLWGARNLLKKQGIIPDVILSLQNTGIKCDKKVRKIIYYHQPLPLYTYKITKLDGFAKTYLFYHYVYPFYVKLFIDKNTYFAVQTELIRQRLSNKLCFPIKRIGVFFPSIEKVESSELKPYPFEEGTFNFVYPAIVSSYKEHKTLVYSLQKMKDNPLLRNIRVHFTVGEEDSKILITLIEESGLKENFVFHGVIPHNELLSMYLGSHGLVFPSVIETIGLPLLETASMGIPVIANDLEYVHEVLNGYEGVHVVKPYDYSSWAEQITRCCLQKYRYPNYQPKRFDSWKRLFYLIHHGEILIDSPSDNG